MAQSAQIDKMSHWHEELVTFLIANPRMKKTEVARHFNVTPAWLSTVINSDVFRAKLAERQDEFFSAVTTPIREKLENLADIAIDRMEDKVQFEEDISEIREVAKLALQSLGYGNGANGKAAPGLAVVQQNNYYSVSPEMLSSAREKIFNRGATYEHQGDQPAARELPPGGGSEVRMDLPNPTPVSDEKAPAGEETAGGDL